jgi:2-dehydropantoate 2-reductase
VESVHGDFIVSPAQATDDMGSIGPVDLVMLCVKDFHVESILPDLPSLIGPNTTVIPLLNGVRAADRLAAELGREVALGGNCSVVSFKAAPGLIEQRSPFRLIAFGEWNGETTPRAQAIAEVLLASGAEVNLSTDIRKTMWTKFLFITAYSGVASVVRLPAGDMRACPETMTMMAAAMEEIESVARVKGVALDSDIVAKTMAFVEGLSDETTASMQRDVQGGRMFELEAMTGSLIRYGDEAGVNTPVNDLIYAVLKPQEMKVA